MYKGNEKDKYVTLDYLPEYLAFTRLYTHHTTLAKSTFDCATHINQVLSTSSRQVIEESLFWSTELRNNTNTVDQEK